MLFVSYLKKNFCMQQISSSSYVRRGGGVCSAHINVSLPLDIYMKPPRVSLTLTHEASASRPQPHKNRRKCG